MEFENFNRLQTQLIEKNYRILGRLREQNDFPLLVQQGTVLYLLKEQIPSSIPVLEQLRQNPITYTPIIHEIIHFENYFFSIEQYISGKSLAELIREKLFTSQETYTLATSLLKTLGEFHKLQLIHRDLTPNNVIKTAENHYYLIDFHASRVYTGEQSTDTVHLGTTGYASPEQYGYAETDARSDIYSLGILLNVVLTGVFPLEEISSSDFWEKIIKKATQLDPNQRYITTQKMLAAIVSEHKLFIPLPPKNNRIFPKPLPISPNASAWKYYEIHSNILWKILDVCILFVLFISLDIAFDFKNWPSKFLSALFCLWFFFSPYFALSYCLRFSFFPKSQLLAKIKTIFSFIFIWFVVIMLLVALFPNYIFPNL